MITVEEMAEVRRQLAGLQALVASFDTRMAGCVAPRARNIEQAVAHARRTLLPQAYISTVAWDILVDLDTAQLAGEQRLYPVDTGSNILSSETQLRYLGALEADDMISLSPEGNGRYRVALTPTGSTCVDQIFAATLAATPAPMAA